MNQNRRPGWEKVSNPEKEWDLEEEWDEALVWQQRGPIGGEKEEELEGARAEIQGVKLKVINH